ncbi:MAG: hypothetical protein V4819_20815 [Verrucomicrobiota bacterium]
MARATRLLPPKCGFGQTGPAFVQAGIVARTCNIYGAGGNGSGHGPPAVVTADVFTQISRLYHIDGGYVHLDEKLYMLGTSVARVKDRLGQAGSD